MLVNLNQVVKPSIRHQFLTNLTAGCTTVGKMIASNAFSPQAVNDIFQAGLRPGIPSIVYTMLFVVLAGGCA